MDRSQVPSLDGIKSQINDVLSSLKIETLSDPLTEACGRVASILALAPGQGWFRKLVRDQIVDFGTKCNLDWERDQVDEALKNSPTKPPAAVQTVVKPQSPNQNRTAPRTPRWRPRSLDAPRMGAHARYYARCNIPVLPLWEPCGSACTCGNPDCRSAGKHPNGDLARHGVNSATRDTKIIARWYAERPNGNIGMPCGVEAVVLDVDPRNGGIESLAKCEEQYGKLAPTRRVITGGGGFHMHFKVPSPVPSSFTIASGLEFKSAGYQVVMPPSKHPSGNRYRWDPDSPCEPAKLPPAWLNYIASKQSGSGSKPRSGTDTDYPPARIESITQGCAWIRHCRDDARKLPEPEWYACLSIVGRCDNGNTITHEWSKDHPSYSPRETDKKLKHALADGGPRTCASIRQNGGESYCASCPNKITSPIVLGIDRAELPPPPSDKDLAEMAREREAIQAESKREREPMSYIEFAPTFLSVVDPPTKDLIKEYLQEGVLALKHGEPRTLKSWAELETAIALATGTPPFGMERFGVSEPVAVLYISQEDAAKEVRVRAKALLRGRGIERLPDTMGFAVHKGINLEDCEWQERLIRDVKSNGFRLVSFDPIRRFALNVDKGPAEVRAVTGYLRRIIVETGATISLVHHDVKPNAQNHDDRRRSHKASGGDWFAAAECPIAFELAGAGRTLVIPEDYKFSVDPQPFSFQLETDDPRNPTWARLIGESASAEDAKFLAMEQKILEYLAEYPAGASGNAIAKALRMRREDVTISLERLMKNGKVDFYGERGRGKKQTWFLSAKEQKSDG